MRPQISSENRVAPWGPAGHLAKPIPVEPAGSSLEAHAALAIQAMEARACMVYLREPLREAEHATFYPRESFTGDLARQREEAAEFCKGIIRGGASEGLHRSRSIQHGTTATASLFGAPILGSRGEPLGAICVMDDNFRTWRDAHGEILVRVAKCISHDLGLAVRLERERKASAQMAKAYHQLARYSGLRDEIAAAFLAPNRPIEARFSDLLRATCRAFGFDRATLACVNFGDAEVFASHPAPVDQERGKISLSDKLAGIVSSGGALLKWEDLGTAGLNRSKDLGGGTPGAYVGIPLVQAGTLLGVLEMTRAQKQDHEWTEADIAVFCVVGLLATSHIELLKQSERIRDSEMEILSLYRRELLSGE